MIDVLYFSDKAVKQKLFERVTGAKKLTLVTVLPPHRAEGNPGDRDPFKALERDFGAVVDQVLVVDEGKIEGMWRDPVVDVADALYANDPKGAYAAARGYFFVLAGEAKASVKKSSDALADLDRLEKAIEQLTMRKRPEVGSNAKTDRRAAYKPGAKTVEDKPAEAPKVADPWAVLGLVQGAPLAEAKKAWKALLVQYHPDKVAHLAPEFRQLAELRTREIMAAWEQLQAESHDD
ncbi:MAG: J domain-containing protein [Myxococcaceae bacterium]|nr:J domain-containing protein [Myxococcaceae bacterium]